MIFETELIVEVVVLLSFFLNNNNNNIIGFQDLLCTSAWCPVCPGDASETVPLCRWQGHWSCAWWHAPTCTMSDSCPGSRMSRASWSDCSSRADQRTRAWIGAPFHTIPGRLARSLWRVAWCRRRCSGHSCKCPRHWPPALQCQARLSTQIGPGSFWLDPVPSSICQWRWLCHARPVR